MQYRLGLWQDGKEIASVDYLEIADDQCHVLAVTVHSDFRRRGLATTGIEILMMRYRYFSAEAQNPAIQRVMRKLKRRDDVTADPRDLRWDRRSRALRRPR